MRSKQQKRNLFIAYIILFYGVYFLMIIKKKIVPPIHLYQMNKSKYYQIKLKKLFEEELIYKFMGRNISYKYDFNIKTVSNIISI